MESWLELGHGHVVNSMARPTCYRCVRPYAACVCDLVQPVDNRTEVVIVQHPRERRHPFGSAKLAQLGLRRCTLAIPFPAFGMVGSDPGDLADAAVLYPGPEAVTLGPDGPRPSKLVVLDGTWNTAAKLIRDHAWLRSLPRVALQPARPGRYRIRMAPDPSRQLSTIEAITLALMAIEPSTAGLGGLLEAFESMIDRQLELRGEAPRGLLNERPFA